MMGRVLPIACELFKLSSIVCNDSLSIQHCNIYVRNCQWLLTAVIVNMFRIYLWTLLLTLQGKTIWYEFIPLKTLDITMFFFCSFNWGYTCMNYLWERIYLKKLLISLVTVVVVFFSNRYVNVTVRFKTWVITWWNGICYLVSTCVSSLDKFYYLLNFNIYLKHNIVL